MKRITILAAAFALAGTVAYGQSAVDAAVKALTDRGFTNVEVKAGPQTSKIEATNGTQKVEITVDNATGRTLKSETANGDGTGTEVGDDNGGSGNEAGDDNGSDSGGDGEGGDDHGGDSGHDGSGHDGSGHDGGSDG